MYCTRHRDRCEERRERWTNMTDEQRRAENDRFNQFLDGAAAKRKNDLVAGLGIIGLVAAALGGGAWLAVRSLKI
jgi:hypothetical protein